MSHLLDQHPQIIAIAGPNGAGKTTFYNSHLRNCAMRFVNADILAKTLHLDAYDAAKVAGNLREELLTQRESFVFETVFSDPIGDKISFLTRANGLGYTVVLCFIGISSAEVSDQRVAMRTSQGGHDVPRDKLVARFPRVLANLREAIRRLPHVWIFDNDDLGTPFRKVAVFRDGTATETIEPIPAWLQALIP